MNMSSAGIFLSTLHIVYHVDLLTWQRLITIRRVFCVHASQKSENVITVDQLAIAVLCLYPGGVGFCCASVDAQQQCLKVCGGRHV
jgi:hypothetical protein